MLIQIAIGTALLLVNILIAAVSAMLLESLLSRAHDWLLREPHRPKLVLLLGGVALLVLGVVTAAVWIWALVYLHLGAFATLEEAVYFSLASFTTLGFGDVLLPPAWRLLAGMEAANGFLNFGLLTALLVEGLRGVRMGQRKHRHKRDKDQVNGDGSG
jgi:hypothetical protein